MRVFPGRLSVCWTFGDLEAKDVAKGGNPHVVISSPDIKKFEIKSFHDFVVLGCDGIFDKLNDQEVVDCVWWSVKENTNQTVHEALGAGASSIMKNSLHWRSLDNVTIVIIAFENFQRAVERHQRWSLTIHDDKRISSNMKRFWDGKTMGPQSVRSS